MDDLQQLSNTDQELLREKMNRTAYYKNDSWNEELMVRVFPLDKEDLYFSVRSGSVESKFNISKEDALDLAERLIYAAKYQS